jgi:hypothetical protein
MQMVADGLLLCSRPKPAGRLQQARLRDARPVDPASQPAPESPRVQRHVSCAALTVAGQCVHISFFYMGAPSMSKPWTPSGASATKPSPKMPDDVTSFATCQYGPVPSDLDVTQALPYLKPAVVDGTRAFKVSDQDSPVIRPFIGQLLITYVLDKGDHFEYIQHHHLNAAGLTEDRLHRHALHNLGLRAAGEVRTAPHGSVTAVLFDGNLESSLILLDPLWPSIADRLGGSEILAAAPARDVLAVCPASSTVGRRELNGLIERLWPVGDHLLTRDLYLRRNDSWQVAEPSDST